MPLTAAAAVLICIIVLTGCAPEATVTSANDTYAVTAAEFAPTFGGITPEIGDTLLLIQLEGSKNSIENAEQDFFNYTKVSCQVSDGTYSAPCKSIAYSEEDGKLAAILVFEVPEAFSKKFSLLGDSIGVTEISLTRS